MEEDFKSIETHFLNNAQTIIRLVTVHSADMGHQILENQKQIQEKQEGEYYRNELGVLIHNIY